MNQYYQGQGPSRYNFLQNDVVQIVVSALIFVLVGVIVGKVAQNIFMNLNTTFGIAQIVLVPFVYKLTKDLMMRVLGLSPVNIEYSSVIFAAVIFGSQRGLIQRVVESVPSPV